MFRNISMSQIEHTWRAENIGDIQLTIPASEMNCNVGSAIHIAVLGYKGPAHYQITLSTSHNTQKAGYDGSLSNEAFQICSNWLGTFSP